MYFIVCDYLAAGLIGLFSALAAWPVPDGWPMPAAMAAAMALGMAVFAVVLNFTAPLAGPFSIMLPGMITCMAASMFWPVMKPMGYSILECAAAGTAFGLIMQALFHWYDARLRGEVARD